jgi:hypothetical protein
VCELKGRGLGVLWASETDAKPGEVLLVDRVLLTVDRKEALKQGLHIGAQKGALHTKEVCTCLV